MIDISEFPKHLESIRIHDWQRLFDLNDRIIKSKSFGEFNVTEDADEKIMAMPYWNWSEITEEFVKIVQDLNLLPVFDWQAWTEGNKILDNSEQDFDSLDEITLCKLLTLVIRADRFNDGYLIFQLGNGTISKIISALSQHVLRSINDTKGVLLKQMQKDLSCAYCGIKESEIEILFDKSQKQFNRPLTKSPQGKSFELDRKDPSKPYNDVNNIIYACYWCNNAKTDTFTYEEFLEVGKAIGKIWKKRQGI